MTFNKEPKYIHAAIRCFLIGAAVIILTVFLNGCLQDGTQGLQGTPGNPGAEGPQGATGTAGNQGPQGTQGPQGIQGATGSQGIGSGLFTTNQPTACSGVGGVTITTFSDPNNTGVYDAGTDTITSTSLVCNGQNGVSGATGSTGLTGVNGSSVTVSVLPASLVQCSTGGYTVQYSNGSSIVDSFSICNGATGSQGQTGLTGATGATGISPLSPVQLIAPCTVASSPWKEQLICLSDGDILSDFSANENGLDTRLSLIPAGSYQDTDSSGCMFSVSVDGNNNTTVSWGGGSNSYGTWVAGSITCQNGQD